MQLDKEKFDCLYRYLILVAQNKRVVMYHELESVFRLSHKLVGLYAGAIGDFCLEQNLPLLNSLIVSAQECQPSDGFANYLEKVEWIVGEIVLLNVGKNITLLLHKYKNVEIIRVLQI